MDRASLSLCLILLLSAMTTGASAQTVHASGVDYSINMQGGKVTFQLDQVTNDANGKTGTVRLELWAMAQPAGGCSNGVGTIVAVDSLGAMAPGTNKSGIFDTLSIQGVPASPGTYNLGLWVVQTVGNTDAYQGCVGLSNPLRLLDPPACAASISISPAAPAIGAAGGSGNVNVTAPLGCAWNADSDASWVTVTPSSQAGSGSVTYTAGANASSHLRTAYLVIAGQQVPLAQSLAGTATVVEFYNPDLQNYFITADPVEQASVDSGVVGRWQRTGGTFKAGGPNQVCRFYGNGLINPATGTIYGPNSHFYTADAAECANLKAIYKPTEKSWKFESNDFATTPAAAGACPSGLMPVYRAYNNGSVKGIDSNHRITSKLADYQATVASGWVPEGIVLCAAQ
jgi:hypothetical protein